MMSDDLPSAPEFLLYPSPSGEVRVEVRLQDETVWLPQIASVQNKLHWAITGETAAELIHRSADATLPAMGLRTWKHAPQGKVLKSDVTVAKNYLAEKHIQELNRLVSAYLDLAENRARRRTLMKMADWAQFLNRFLELSDYEVLSDKGRVSALEAKLKAEAQYERFRIRQDREYRSDFDMVVEEARRLGDSGRAQGSAHRADRNNEGDSDG